MNTDENYFTKRCILRHASQFETHWSSFMYKGSVHGAEVQITQNTAYIFHNYKLVTLTYFYFPPQKAHICFITGNS